MDNDRAHRIIHLKKKLFDNLSFSVVSPITRLNDPGIIINKGDSTAINYYFRPYDTNCLTGIRMMKSAPILLPDKSSITSYHMGFLPNKYLSTLGRKVKILPQLHSASLTSVGKLCDDGCKVHFDDRQMKVLKKDNQIIMDGIRNDKDGLYDLHIAKVNLTADNYQSSQPYPGMYTRRNPSKISARVKNEYELLIIGSTC